MQSATSDNHRPYVTELGATGTRFVGGRLYGHEFNDQLKGYAWVEKTQKMLTDAIIKSARNARLGSLLSAKWRVRPGVVGDALAEQLADEVRENFGLDGRSGNLSIPWEEQIALLLLFEDVGYRYFEEIWREENGRIWLDCWADRLPLAHGRWLSKDKRHLDGVQQRVMNWGDGAPVIPANKLLLLVREQEGSNWEGRGTLRACHFEWELMVHTLSMLSVSVERWAVSTPQMSYDQQKIWNSLYKPTVDKLNKVIKDAEQGLVDYLSRQSSLLVRAEGIDYSTFGDGQMNPSAIEAVEMLLTRRVHYAYLVQFLSLGQGSTGARSVGETHIDFFHTSATNALDYLAGRIGGRGRPGAGTIGRLVAYNHGDVDPRLLPRLEHSGLSVAPLAQAFNVLGQLKQHNLVTDTDALEAQILDVLEAGPLQEIAKQLRAARHRYAQENPDAMKAPTTEKLPK
ncbi:hypothetical protein KKB55_07675 [Myxococcota bacterium]|nr:hypothetical protein [Myxococcota bacterium]MBU1897634.1 hypothetical protein [Myxococcota bacterium]